MLVRDKYRGTPEYTKARAELVRVARAKGLITYKDLARVAGLPLVGNNMAREVGSVLGAISEDEVAAGRPMLSAVVVKVQGYAGAGFFGLARELGRFHTGQGEDAFWEAERDAVYDAWAAAGD